MPGRGEVALPVAGWAVPGCVLGEAVLCGSVYPTPTPTAIRTPLTSQDRPRL